MRYKSGHIVWKLGDFKKANKDKTQLIQQIMAIRKKNLAKTKLSINSN